MAATSADGPIVFIDVAKEEACYPIEEIVLETPRDNQPETAVKNESPKMPYVVDNEGHLRCTICNRTTLNEEKMLQHIRRVHRGENPFQCYMCEYSTYNKVLFEEHVRIHQGIKPYKCAHCPYRSASKKNTKKHEQIHRPNNPLKCKECPFIARNTRVLNCHKLQAHVTKTKEDTHECRKCNTAFLDSTMFNNHRKNRKRCEICSQLFCSQLLKKHEREVHGLVKKLANKKQLFVCQICEWASNSKPKILLHLIHHPGQDLSECKVDVTVLRQCGILPAA